MQSQNAFHDAGRQHAISPCLKTQVGLQMPLSAYVFSAFMGVPVTEPLKMLRVDLFFQCTKKYELVSFFIL